MEASAFTTKNNEESSRKNEHATQKYLKTSTKHLFLSLSFVLVVSLFLSVLYFTPVISCLQLFLKGETRRAISFFIYTYRIIGFLFRGDKRGDLVKVLTGPGGELTKNTLYVNLLENAKEAHERIVNVDWLYWAMLFLPFYVIYALIQESFLKLRRNVRYLKEDCNLKNTFIKWQGSMHVAMHQRIAELRVEVKTLNSLLDGYRQNAKENELKSKLLRKNYLEEEAATSKIDTDVNSEAERFSMAKKNKSDSIIEERRETMETPLQIHRRTRPKTEEGRYGTPDPYSQKKSQTHAWIEAKKRLQERSKEILKSRVDSVRRAKEEESTQQMSFAVVMPTEDEKNALVSTKALSGKPTLEKRISIARSKFTARKASDDSKSFINRDAKTPHKRTTEEYKVLAHKDVISELKARQQRQPISVSATDLLQQQESLNRLTSKRRSLSEAGKSIVRCEMTSKKMQDHHGPLPTVNFGNEEDIVANLRLEGMGRVTSYTEIYKKKVHVPRSGKAPEITIEGKRRWCF